MESTDNFTGTLAEQVEAILTATPQPAEAFAEVLGRKVSSVKGTLAKLVEAETVMSIEVDGQPTTYRLPKRERANYGYKRNTSQGREADARTESLHKVLEAADGTMSKSDIAEAISELEGAKVTDRAVVHVLWRHSITRHESGQDVQRPFVRQPEKGKYELDAEYEAANTEPEAQPEPESQSDAA